jgi:FtsH-binding integral membrane protein
MEVEELERIVNGNGRSRSEMVGLSLPVLLKKVYVWMAMALVISAITAYGVATTPAIMTALIQSPGIMFGLAIAELALVIGINAGINKLSISTATLLFILFAAVNGATLSTIFLVYNVGSIVKVFLITAGTFGAMAVYGSTTKTDLSKMGGILMMALIGLIIATVVNIFVKSQGFDLIISYIGVLLFVGLTAYDTQRIKRWLEMGTYDGETGQKVALLGAMSLYLDFINLFLYLLRIFGNNRD